MATGVDPTRQPYATVAEQPPATPGTPAATTLSSSKQEQAYAGVGNAPATPPPTHRLAAAAGHTDDPKAQAAYLKQLATLYGHDPTKWPAMSTWPAESAQPTTSTGGAQASDLDRDYAYFASGAQDPAKNPALRTDLDGGSVAGWTASYGQHGFMACNQQQQWSYVSKNSDGSYKATSLDGTAGPQAMNLDDLKSNFKLLQDPSSAAAFTQLRDPKTGQVSTFSGFSQGADGTAQVNLKGSGGSTQSTMSLKQFADQYGNSGISGLITGATSTPSSYWSKNYHDTTNPATGTGDLKGTGTISDVKQGGLFDCYFDAGMSAAVKANPQALTNIIKPSANGNPDQYDVTLYTRDGEGGEKLQPHTVTVDGRLPLDDIGRAAGTKFTLDASGKGDSNLAPALIEKAYALLDQSTRPGGGLKGNTGYFAMEQGDPAAALEAITGKPADTHDLTSSSGAQALWADAGQADQGKAVIMATTRPETKEGDTMLDGMLGGHAYVVVGTNTDANGQRWVTVHNAAGDTDKNQTISFEDAQKIFGTSYVGS